MLGAMYQIVGFHFMLLLNDGDWQISNIKRIGYLASQILNLQSPVLLLGTNSLKKENSTRPILGWLGIDLVSFTEDKFWILLNDVISACSSSNLRKVRVSSYKLVETSWVVRVDLMPWDQGWWWLHQWFLCSISLHLWISPNQPYSRNV
jgi:hypothetical protein